MDTDGVKDNGKVDGVDQTPPVVPKPPQQPPKKEILDWFGTWDES